MPVIKNRLKEILKETKTSERALARAIGVRPNTINDLAKNKTQRPDMEIIAQVMLYFGMTDVSEILYYEDEAHG